MITRRRALAAGGFAVVGAAGCLADERDIENEPNEDGSGASNAANATDSDAGDPSAADPDAPLVTTRGSDATERDGGETDADAPDDENRLVLARYGDVATVSEIEERYQQPGYQVTIEFTERAAETFVDRLESVGGLEQPGERDLFLHLEGERVGSYAIGPSLADAMRTGDWNGEFLFPADERETLERFRAQFESADP